MQQTTSLSLKGVNALLEEGKKGIIVQILEPETIVNNKPDNKSKKFKVFISDGIAKNKAVLGNEAALEFETAGVPSHCVVRVNDLMQQNQGNKRLVIITKIDIINTDVNEVIGKPLEFQEWLSNGRQNREGSSQIPQKFLANYKNSASNYSTAPNSMPARESQFNNAGSNRAFNNGTQSNAYGGTVENSSMNSNQGNTFNQRSSYAPQANVNRNTNQNTSNSFGNQQQQQQQQQQKAAPKRQGSISMIGSNHLNTMNEDEFMSVSQLSPSASFFIIKVRVTNKSDLRTFKKREGTGEGYVFSIDLIDKFNSEISATFFGDAAQHFHSKIQENHVYIMRGGYVKMVAGKFAKKNNDYQIVFDKMDSQIDEAKDDTEIKFNKFEFNQIKAVESLQVNSLIDVAGFAKVIKDIQEVSLRKTNELKERRVVSLYDDSNILIELTLWGELARNFNFPEDSLIVVKNARVSDFGGVKALSTSFDTKIMSGNQLQDEPIIAHLISWRANSYDDNQLQSLVGESKSSLPYTIEEINELISSEAITEKASFETVAYVSHIKTENAPLFYAGCKNKDKCQKKAEQIGDVWRCGYCNENFERPIYRYTLSIKLSDHTGSIWINAFDKVAQTIVEMSADDLKHKKDQEEASVAEIFRQAHQKDYKFRLFVKKDTYGDSTRLKTQATRIDKLNFKSGANELFGLLEQYAAV